MPRRCPATTEFGVGREAATDRPKPPASTVQVACSARATVPRPGERWPRALVAQLESVLVAQLESVPVQHLRSAAALFRCGAPRRSWPRGFARRRCCAAGPEVGPAGRHGQPAPLGRGRRPPTIETRRWASPASHCSPGPSCRTAGWTRTRRERRSVRDRGPSRWAPGVSSSRTSSLRARQSRLPAVRLGRPPRIPRGVRATTSPRRRAVGLRRVPPRGSESRSVQCSEIQPGHLAAARYCAAGGRDRPAAHRDRPVGIRDHLSPAPTAAPTRTLGPRSLTESAPATGWSAPLVARQVTRSCVTPPAAGVVARHPVHVPANLGPPGSPRSHPWQARRLTGPALGQALENPRPPMAPSVLPGPARPLWTMCPASGSGSRPQSKTAERRGRMGATPTRGESATARGALRAPPPESWRVCPGPVR